MATTADGIVYPVASDFIAPLNTHLQALAESVQDAIATKVTYTPTFTGLTLGNGTVSATYVKNGGIIVDEIVITFGSSTAITGAVIIGGLQAANSSSALISGTANLHDSGTTYYAGAVRHASTTSVEVHAQNSAGTYVALTQLSATVPHTWATGDQIIIKTVRIAA